MSASMAEVLRREFSVDEGVGEYNASAVWGSPEAIEAVLAANGYGKLEDARGEGYGAGWTDCLLDIQNDGAKITRNRRRRPE